MPVTRIHWEDLPSAARAAVEQHTGSVLRAETASGGANSGIAVLATTADASLFIKGVPSEHPQARTQQREAEINPHLPPASPRLLWRVQVAGWDLIGYERIIGRHADYAPGSDDLPLVAEAIAELQASRCPDLELKRAEQRWGSYADAAEAELFAGQTLLHTDLAPHNILITERAHIIDWAWPTRGAAWIDPAVLILRLMEAGHGAQDADQWAERFPSWQRTPHGAVAAFSAANARLWDEIAHADPQEWKKHMALLSWDWVMYWRSHSP